MFNEGKVSVLQDEIRQMVVMYIHNNMNVLNTTELYT